MKPCDIGGQAVMEGVMMRGQRCMAMAVRLPDDNISVSVTPLTTTPFRKKINKVPVVRGVFSFIDSMIQGYRQLMDSAKLLGLEEEEPSALERKLAKSLGVSAEKLIFGAALALALAIGVGLFFVLPSLAAFGVRRFTSSGLLLTLVEALVRVVIFLGYLFLISRMKEIHRVFCYHGAEHKTIACYEHELPMTNENARAMTRLHPRCGTSFLFLVMIVSILCYSLISWQGSVIGRVLIRLALLPVVAGVSYEVLKFAARHENWLTRAVRFPGLMLQKLTTQEPDDGMLTVARVAFETALSHAGGAESFTLDPDGQPLPEPAESPAAESEPAESPAEPELQDADQADLADLAALDGLTEAEALALGGAAPEGAAAPNPAAPEGDAPADPAPNPAAPEARA
ncbi:MAG: DUF1385 domain-containing protein [Christensenellales bacterium]|jgi:uncharacterized protein YqhQ